MNHHDKIDPDAARRSAATRRSASPRTVGQTLRRALPATALVGAVLGVTAFGPGAYSALADGLHHRGGSAIVVAPSVVSPSSTTSAPGGTAPAALGGIIAPATSPMAADAAPATSAPAATAAAPTASSTPLTAGAPALGAAPASPTTAAPFAEVTAIQVVPAARDVVVEIDGASYASASDGTITLPPAARHGSVQFVGFRETPALRQATFGAWADGNLDAMRSLDSLSGPVVQLGITISYRVTVAAEGADSVDFFSALGPLTIPVGATQWVVATQATSSPSGLVAQPVNYTVQSVERFGEHVPVAPISYAPTPEALWTVAAA